MKGGNKILVQSPEFVLNKFLPYPVDKNAGKAKFDSDKCVLEVTLPVIKEEIVEKLWNDTKRYEESQKAVNEQFKKWWEISRFS